MQIRVIEIERQAADAQCGTLHFELSARSGILLWVAQWHGGERVTVEFVPGEGATRQDIHDHHAPLVDTLIQTLFERITPPAPRDLRSA